MDALNDDTLVCVFTALSIREILLLRQTSRTLYRVSEQHAVWSNACANEVVANGIPFPKRPLASFSSKDLERETLRAYRLGLNWRSPKTKLYHVVSTPARIGPIEQIKFLSRHGRCWIITTSLGIWWTMCVWDCSSAQVVAQWSPGKALFNGVVVNTDDESEGAIAISVCKDGRTTVEILAVFDDDAGGIVIKLWTSLETSRKPIALIGDLVALCDHDSETTILNWKTQEQALLKSPDTWQDKPLHVAFTQGSVLVARARSICLFEQPRMVSPGEDLNTNLPRVFTSFGWVDGVSLALKCSDPLGPPNAAKPSLSLLVRKKGDDPWRPAEQFQFMSLDNNHDHAGPHTTHGTSIEHESSSFPFNLVSTLVSYHQGPLRCSDMILGSYGTAVWVQPTDWAAAGLIADDNFMQNMPVASSREALVVALLPGLLNRGSLMAETKVVLENEGNGWSCLDYDEARGLIALGSSCGEVTIYRL